jgi:hypothetical protein
LILFTSPLWLIKGKTLSIPLAKLFLTFFLIEPINILPPFSFLTGILREDLVTGAIGKLGMTN